MLSLVLKEFRDHKLYLLKKDKGISHALMKGQKSYDKREFDFMKLLRSSIKEGDCCADIGANIGFVSLQMAKIIMPSGHLFAIEPDNSNIEVLRKNIEINGYGGITTIYHSAISDNCGETDFYVSQESNLGALNKNPHCSGKTIKVQVTTIDTLFADIRLPDFYKMDVEGHEVNVLNGMHNVAKRSKSGTKILMEVHPQFYSNNLNMEEALRSMLGLGFYFKHVLSAGVPIPDKFAEKGYKPSIVYDNFPRAIYNDMREEDVIEFCSKSHKQWMPSKKRYSPKIIRAIMLEKK